MSPPSPSQPSPIGRLKSKLRRTIVSLARRVHFVPVSHLTVAEEDKIAAVRVAREKQAEAAALQRRLRVFEGALAASEEKAEAARARVAELTKEVERLERDALRAAVDDATVKELRALRSAVADSTVKELRALRDRVTDRAKASSNEFADLRKKTLMARDVALRIEQNSPTKDDISGLADRLAEIQKRGLTKTDLGRVSARLAQLRKQVKQYDRRLEVGAEQLDEARERELKMTRTMLSRELRSAREVGSWRSAAGYFRARQDDGSLELEAAALRGEAARLALLGAVVAGKEASGEVNDLLLDALERGMAAVCPMAPDDLLPLVHDPDVRIGVVDAEGEAGAVAEWLSGCAATVTPFTPGAEADTPFDCVISARPLEIEDDPLVHLTALAAGVREGGVMLLAGSLLGRGARPFETLWKTPPRIFTSALPEWSSERMMFAGPGAAVGVELFDPALELRIKPAAGGGEPLLIPAFMGPVALLRHVGDNGG